MGLLIKIGEVVGVSTGYGESVIRYYASEDQWQMVLLSGGKRCGKLFFDSWEVMARVKEILGDHFRITPPKRLI